MRRRGFVVTTATSVAALSVLGWSPAVGAVGHEHTNAAEGQFEAYLTKNTALVPLDVTCAPLPDAAPTGPMICYALVSDRQTVAALAELESPGVYHFISINKVEPGPVPGTNGGVTPESDVATNQADAAVLTLIDTVTSPASRLPAMLMQANPDVASVDNVSFFAATGTLEISVTTTAANDDVRNAIAFAATEVVAGIWAEGQPLRDPSATIQPRFELTVDGTLYSSAYGMMTSIADGTMAFTDWLELTGVSGLAAGDRFDRRAEVKRYTTLTV